MADNRKYYYLKLKEDFFDTDEMKILESMKDGYLYSNILLKLYLKSLSNSGRLMYRNVIPYTPEILATLTGHQVGTVEKALDVFKKLDLIEMLDNGAIYMMDIQNFIGQSSSEADRQREYYNRMKAEKEALAGESTETPELPEPKEPVLPVEQKSNKAIGNYTTDFEELWEAYPRKLFYNEAAKGKMFPEGAMLDVRIIAYYEIPKSTSKKKRREMLEHRIRPTKKPDWDNIGKIVCDSLNLVAYHDDSAVVDAQVRKFYSETPRVDEFTAVVKEAISNWSGGKVINIVKSDEVTESDLAMMKSAAARLNDNIEKAQTAAGKPAGEGDDPEVDTEDKKDQGKKKQSKGDNEDMKIDKSKMTQAELLILEDIEKRYGVADDPAQTEQTPEGKPAVTKSVEKPEQNQETPADGEDIYKGLNPAVKAEIEALRKFREDAENRELEAVAGKYEIIGKKKEELVPMLKSLRATGGTAYNDMIAVLDATVEAVNKSGVFSEVGKSGHGSAHVSDAEGKIEGIAKSYMQKEPSMSYTDALAKAWEDNPDLMDAYDAEEGF